MERNDYLKMLVEEMHSTTMATIGAEFRRCGEQIEEAEQLTFQQKIGDSRVFTDAAENLMDGCRKCSITGMFG